MKVQQKEIPVLFLGNEPDDVTLLRNRLAADRDEDRTFRLDHSATPEETESYEIVLLDLRPPDENGLELFRELRDESPDVPVVVITGRFASRMARDLIGEGAQDVIPGDSLDVPGVVAHSITYALERKQREDQYEQLQKQLIQAEKLDSMGRLAAGVAHDLSTPLASIRLSIEFLKNFGADITGDELDEILTGLDEATELAINISSGMLNLSKDAPFEPVPDCLSGPVEGALRLLNYKLKTSKVRIDTDLDLNAMTMLDDTKIEQIIINLINNAIQAMDESSSPVKQITIRTRTVSLTSPEFDGAARRLQNWLNDIGGDDEIIMLEVTDTGPGVPPKKVDHIFEPFFTTKTKQEGTGLGLAVVKRIVDMHDALIEAKNQAGGGLLVRVCFKALAKVPAVMPLSKTNITTPTNTDAKEKNIYCG